MFAVLLITQLNTSVAKISNGVTVPVLRRGSLAARLAPRDRARCWPVESNSGPFMDRTAVVKVGAAASASVCALLGGVVLTQYIVAKKKRAGKKTRIIEMVS